MHRNLCIVLFCAWAGASAPAWAQSDTRSESSGETDKPSNDEGAVVPPRLVHLPDVEYPEAALGTGVEGVVQLELLLSNTGTVAQILAVEGPSVLKSSAVAAAKAMRFTPALLDGTPIEVQVPYAFRFVAPPSSPLGAEFASPDTNEELAKPYTNELPATPEADELPSISPAPIGTPAGEKGGRGADVVVLSRRPARSATDFRIRLDLENLAPPAGTSGPRHCAPPRGSTSLSTRARAKAIRSSCAASMRFTART